MLAESIVENVEKIDRLERRVSVLEDARLPAHSETIGSVEWKPARQ
jgi:hypothetical protein